ncbi:MAG TPA: hypothetical protein VF950_09085 [Planctomycetota bacterium]
MRDWRGVPMPPSRLAALTRDDPRLRAYDTRKGRSLSKSFEHYLEAVLKPLERWEQIRDFLTGCRYSKDDVEHDGRRDVWLHPEDFERSLKGDCEDHALWAWVQLARLKWDVRFTVGIWEGIGHAWVMVYKGAKIQLLEATEKRGDRILSEPTAAYEPVWSVDARLRFFVHAKP